MEGPTSSWRSRNRLTCLTLQEHDDDDDDDDDDDEQTIHHNTEMWDENSALELQSFIPFIQFSAL